MATPLFVGDQAFALLLNGQGYFEDVQEECHGIYPGMDEQMVEELMDEPAYDDRHRRVAPFMNLEEDSMATFDGVATFWVVQTLTANGWVSGATTFDGYEDAERSLEGVSLEDKRKGYRIVLFNDEGSLLARGDDWDDDEEEQQ